MLTLFTGLPGNGKTLFALTYIKEKAARENRPVFYNNIKGLTLPWTEIKADEWMSAPDGAIIVLDECQSTFPTKSNGAALPRHYEDLATHRHHGLDIFLITQHPSLVHNFVRRLVGQHFHSVRKFGFERATIFEWDKVATTPEDKSSQKSAVPIKWSFNKEAYSWYKSAELHTVKKRIPVKIFLALAFALVVVGIGYWWLSSFDKKATEMSPVVASQPSGPVSEFLPPGERPQKAPFDPVADAHEYVAMNTPRVEGLAYTAPKYDAITVPVRAPVPAACIQIGSVRPGAAAPRCQCYSQRGTKLDVQYNMCIQMAQNGWFKDFESDPQESGQDRAQQSVQVLSSRPDAPLPENRALPPVVERGPIVVSMSSPPGASEQRTNAPRDDGPPPARARTAMPIDRSL